MDSKIGVLYQDEISLYRILFCDKGYIIPMDNKIPHPANMFQYGNGFGDLYDIMAEKDIERLWIFPDTKLSKNVRREHFSNIPDTYDWYTPRKMDYDGQPATLRIRRKQGGIDRYIIFPAHMECAIPAPGLKGQWDLPSPDYLYWTVYYIEQELGVPLLWSGGKMGEELLRRSHSSLKTPIQPLDTGLGYQWDIVQKSAMDRLVWKTPYPLEK